VVGVERRRESRGGIRVEVGARRAIHELDANPVRTEVSDGVDAGAIAGDVEADDVRRDGGVGVAVITGGVADDARGNKKRCECGSQEVLHPRPVCTGRASQISLQLSIISCGSPPCEPVAENNGLRAVAARATYISHVRSFDRALAPVSLRLVSSPFMSCAKTNLYHSE
jgi:hypothetical protein